MPALPFKHVLEPTGHGSLADQLRVKVALRHTASPLLQVCDGTEVFSGQIVLQDAIELPEESLILLNHADG